MAIDRPRVLLDACVLYRDLLRRLLLDVAAAGLFIPLWSERILGEWAHAAARAGGDAGAAIVGLRAAWPDAAVASEGAGRLALPDPDDAHVLAAAIGGRADIVLTLNLRAFPARALSPHGLLPLHPDPFLLGLWRQSPDPVAAAAASVCAAARAAGSQDGDRALLKRAGLPRLARALVAGATV